MTSAPASPEGTPLPETLIKNVTVKDKLLLDGWEFVYTADREIFTVQNVFLYRELEVGRTYAIEYQLTSPGSLANFYHATGMVLDIKDVTHQGD